MSGEVVAAVAAYSSLGLVIGLLLWRERRAGRPWPGLWYLLRSLFGALVEVPRTIIEGSPAHRREVAARGRRERERDEEDLRYAHALGTDTSYCEKIPRRASREVIDRVQTEAYDRAFGGMPPPGVAHPTILGTHIALPVESVEGEVVSALCLSCDRTLDPVTGRVFEG